MHAVGSNGSRIPPAGPAGVDGFVYDFFIGRRLLAACHWLGDLLVSAKGKAPILARSGINRTPRRKPTARARFFVRAPCFLRERGGGEGGVPMSMHVGGGVGGGVLFSPFGIRPELGCSWVSCFSTPRASFGFGVWSVWTKALSPPVLRCFLPRKQSRSASAPPLSDRRGLACCKRTSPLFKTVGVLSRLS